MLNIEHPVISNMEATGFPDGKAPRTPHCPICGAECGTVLEDNYGTIVGCSNCVTLVDAYEREECFPEDFEI